MYVPSILREYANKAIPEDELFIYNLYLFIIVIYLRSLNSVIKMHDLSGFQRISQTLNESAPL